MAKILVADDDAHVVRVMSLWLSRRGHQITETRNGAAALEVLDSPAGVDIDLVISDMNMPVLDGLGLLKGVRERRGPDLPFLVLSSRCDQAELADELRKYGAKLFPKPFVPSRLVVAIDELLGVETREG